MAELIITLFIWTSYTVLFCLALSLVVWLGKLVFYPVYVIAQWLLPNEKKVARQQAKVDQLQHQLNQVRALKKELKYSDQLLADAERRPVER